MAKRKEIDETKFESPEECCVTCDPQDLTLFIYLINSGVQWIKKMASYNALDLHDKRTLDFGKNMLKALTDEYIRVEKGSPKEEVA